MLRRFQAPSARRLLQVAAVTWIGSTRRSTSSLKDPADEAADAFELFDDDMWFLDEMFGEGAQDLFSFIPEEDASLLSREK